MSSTEQTAEYFKDKSEEEIINWMTRNLTTDQIKSCLDGESTGKIEEVKPGKLTGNDLRKFCAGKRYVIHKIEGDNVLFWYYLSKSNKWNYSKESLSSFPQTIDQLDADECGQDTIIDSEDVKEAYNNNELTGENLFVQNNEDLDMNKTFNDVKNEYLKENINYSWMDTLILAINIQKNIYVPKEYNKLFKFSSNFIVDLFIGETDTISLPDNILLKLLYVYVTLFNNIFSINDKLEFLKSKFFHIKLIGKNIKPITFKIFLFNIFINSLLILGIINSHLVLNSSNLSPDKLLNLKYSPTCSINNLSFFLFII